MEKSENLFDRELNEQFENFVHRKSNKNQNDIMAD